MNTLVADAGGLLAVLARGAAFAGIAGTVGACAFRFAVVRTARNPASDADRAAADAVTGFGAAAAVVTGVAIITRIVAQAQAFASPDEPLFPMIGTVLTTGWGRVAAIQFGGAAVAFVGMTGARAYGRWGWATALAGCAVLAATPAFMGHAIVATNWGTVAVADDILHVLAGAGWAGAVGALAWTITRERVDADAAATLIDRFKPLAITAAATLLATGVVSAAIQLRTPKDLVTTNYGRLLLVKVAVVLVAAAMGRRHSRTAARDVRTGQRAAVTRSITREALVLAVVFAVTAILAGSPRPGE